MQNKKAFSFVEIIIAISIIVLLAVIGISSKQGYDDNMNNTKVVSDTETINNALESYSEENKDLPIPGGNKNFFKVDTSYSHSYDDIDTYGVYGSLTENTIPKKYLDILPLDPRTNSYYSYGKTKEGNAFETASIQKIDGEYQAKVTGNYTAENGPYNLIREYNGSNFVYNKSQTNLPYNPEELILIATTATGAVFREGDTVTVPAGQTLELFFSDGSVSVLGSLTSETKLTLNKLNFPSGNNLSTIVKLSLGAGTIWTKATNLNNDSEFEIYTTDSTAAVRGTIFGVTKDEFQGTTIEVLDGKVELYDPVTEANTIVTKLILDESVIYEKVNEINRGNIIINKGENTTINNYQNALGTSFNYSTGTIDVAIIEDIKDKLNFTDSFSIYDNVRSAETLARIGEDIVEDEIKKSLSLDDQNVLPGCNLSFPGIGCVDTENTLGTPWNLAAYAPLNTSLELYNSGTGITASYEYLNVCGGGTTNAFLGSDYKTCNTAGKTGKTGVFLDNVIIGGNDELKYELNSLSLSGSFAIEMSVLGSALKRTVGYPYYLFSIDNQLSYLLNNNGLNYYNSGVQAQIGIGSLHELSDTSFYKIQFLKEGTGTTVNINSSTGIILSATGEISNINSSDFYVGSTKDSTQQWNHIIDYIKFYKKN